MGLLDKLRKQRPAWKPLGSRGGAGYTNTEWKEVWAYRKAGFNWTQINDEAKRQGRGHITPNALSQAAFKWLREHSPREAQRIAKASMGQRGRTRTGPQKRGPVYDDEGDFLGVEDEEEPRPKRPYTKRSPRWNVSSVTTAVPLPSQRQAAAPRQGPIGGYDARVASLVKARAALAAKVKKEREAQEEAERADTSPEGLRKAALRRKRRRHGRGYHTVKVRNGSVVIPAGASLTEAQAIWEAAQPHE